jgi:hypothetical protein
MFRLPVKAPMGGCDAPSLLGALTARETFKVGIDLGSRYRWIISTASLARSQLK